MARRRSNPREFPRTSRLAELYREVLAEELERLDDPRLEMVTITGVRVDADMGRAVAYYSALNAAEEGRIEEVEEAMSHARVHLQQTIASQVRARRTPNLRFERDTVIESALRIEGIIANLRDDDDEEEEEEEEEEEGTS